MLSLAWVPPGGDQGQGRNTEIRMGPQLGELRLVYRKGHPKKLDTRGLQDAFALLYQRLMINRVLRARWEVGFSGIIRRRKLASARERLYRAEQAAMTTH